MNRAPSPGLLLPVTVRCECSWTGVERDRAGALLLWQEHARHAGHDLKETTHHEEG